MTYFLKQFTQDVRIFSNAKLADGGALLNAHFRCIKNVFQIEILIDNGSGTIYVSLHCRHVTAHS